MPLNKSTTYHAPPPCFKKFSPTYMLRSDYRVEAVILCHVCQAMKPPPPPFLAASLPPPQTQPPPPPALKMVREWEGVGVWPVATPPPWIQRILTFGKGHHLPKDTVLLILLSAGMVLHLTCDSLWSTRGPL